MAVSSAKNHVVVVVDLSDAAGPPAAEHVARVCEVAQTVVKYKALFHPKNEVAVVLVGCSGEAPAAQGAESGWRGGLHFPHGAPQRRPTCWPPVLDMSTS